MRMNKLDFRNKIYPGGLWGKRIRHLLSVSTIGLTAFLQHAKSDLMEKTINLANYSYEESLDFVREVDRFLNQGPKKYAVGWMGGADLQRAPQVLVKKLTEGKELASRIHGVSQILSFLTYAFVLNIAYSGYWLYCNVRLGSACGLIRRLLAIAVAVNLCTVLLRYLWSYTLL